MEFLLNHIYFLGTLFYLGPFLIVYFLNKKHRKEMLLVGSMFGICALILAPYALSDYWKPTYVFDKLHVEDFLYGFFYGGFITYIPHLLFKKIKHHKKRPWFILLSALSTGFIFLICLYIFPINSIYSHVLPLLLVGIFSIFTSIKNFKIQLFSGSISLVLTFFIFKILLLLEPNLFTKYWKLENLSNIFISKILLEEYIFAFFLGFGGSMFYETITGGDLV